MPRISAVALAAALSVVVLAVMAESTRASVVATAKPAASVAKVEVVSTPELEKLRVALAQKIPDLNPENVRPSPIAGIYEVQHGHLFGYVSADGQYLIQGDLVNIQTGEQVTENRRRADRLDAVKTLGEGKSIDFMPKPPVQTKYVVTVFTDIDCGYCRKLHSEIASYNAQGIGVRYLFFPRSGPNTESFSKAQAVWCSADRRDALTKAKSGQAITAAKKSCADPVLKEYMLGSELGVRGTPALLLPSGELYPGYVPAQQLAALLAEDAKP